MGKQAPLVALGSFVHASAAVMVLLGGLVSQVHSHATEVRKCFTAEGSLRIFVEHWHGGWTTVTTATAGTMTIRKNHIDGTPSQTLYPKGVITNKAAGSLPGCPTGDILVTTCGSLPGTSGNDWVYYDFDVTCITAVDYTLLSGNTVVLTEGCTNLYPANIRAAAGDCTPAATATPTSRPTATPTATPTSTPTATPTATPTSALPATPTATPTSATVSAPGTWTQLSTATGWNKPVRELRYGNVGLVGHYWSELDAKYEFDSQCTLVGTRCDDPGKNAYNIFASNDGVNWQAKGVFKGGVALPSPVSTKFARVRWESTVGSNGFHFEFRCEPAPTSPPTPSPTTEALPRRLVSVIV